MMTAESFHLHLNDSCKRYLLLGNVLSDYLGEPPTVKQIYYLSKEIKERLASPDPWKIIFDAYIIRGDPTNQRWISIKLDFNKLKEKAPQVLEAILDYLIE